MGFPRLGVQHVFLVIGLGLLSGAGFWYELGVRRPQTWPRTEAEVVSSRVINPTGPNDYTHELVLRYQTGEQLRERTLIPNWTTSSYDMVRGYVDEYPAGLRLPVAINPEDPDDVRYEIGATTINLIGPGILATLGIVFAGVYVGVALWGRSSRRRATRFEPSAIQDPAAFTRRHHEVMASGAKMARRVGMLFVAIGVIVLIVTAFVLRSTTQASEEWPSVEATVLDSRVISARSSSSRSSGSSARYDTQVTFRYVVNGVTYESASSTGVSTSSRSDAEERAAFYAPGSSHVITVMPTDPNIIRFDAGASWSGVVLTIAMVAMALVFITLGGLVWKLAGRPMKAPAIPDIDAEDAEIAEAAERAEAAEKAKDRFRPRL